MTLAEPSPSTASAPQSNNYPISNGYTYLARSDGNSWLTGPWAVTIVAANAAGESFTYTGTVDVGPADKRLPQLPAATMPSTVIGTTGAKIHVNH